MRRFKTYPCEDCGVVTTRLRDPGQPLVCLDHGIARAVRAAVALAEAKAAGWPEGGAYSREQFAAPMRARWQAWGVRGAR